MKRIFTVSLCLIAVMAFSFSAIAQQNMLSEFGNADVTGKSTYEPSEAPVVLLDQAPNQTNGIFSDCNCAACGTGAQVLAESFVVTTASPTFGITEIVSWGGYFNENIPNTTDDFQIDIYDDAAGVPGTVIYTASGLLPTSRVATGVVLFGVDEYIFTFDYSASPIMIPTNGTYYIRISNNSVESGSFFWETGALDAVNGVIGNSWGTECTVLTWNSDVVTDMAIQINGDDDIGGGGGGLEPEVLYYQFNETGSDSTENLADPGSGFAWGQIEGDQTMGPSGQFGDALVGSGSNGTLNNVNTGWVPDLGLGDWTISMWLNNMPAGTALNYLFGETNTGANFRCFYSGAAGEFAILVRTSTIGGTDIVIPGVGPGPSVTHIVYDSSGPTVLGYVNGVLVLSVPQSGPLTLTGTGADNFRVGGHNGSTSGGLPVGSFMDEFRFYSRALDSAEVANTWDIQVPVELTSFTASVDDNDVTLNWETATEINNSGFQVEKKSNGEYKSIGFVPGFGSTTEPRAYTFSDINLAPGAYTYRLKQIDYDGTFEYSDAVEVEILVPDVYSLHQNYPNPFNPSTKITFTIAANALVTLKVFDVLGQEVMTLINQDLTAGVHTYDFDAAGFNSGVYFYRIEANGIDGTNFTNVKKMILLK